MKKHIVRIGVALTLCVCILALSSCAAVVPGLSAFSDSLKTGALASRVSQLEGEVSRMTQKIQSLGSGPVGDVYAGDTYEVNVTNEGENLSALSHTLLSGVSVVCTFTEERMSIWNSSPTTVQQSQAGAGVIYRLDKAAGDAIVITNFHVVYDRYSTTENGISDKIKLYLYGQEASDYAIPATFVGGSMNYDIAVLKVQNSDVIRASAARAATFANSDTVSVLDAAIAVGNPEGRGISATVGRVNVDSEYIQLTAPDESGTIKLRVMRIDAAVNGGNSGGGLYNEEGKLIGIVNAKMNSSGVDNIGYAIPSNVAKYIADNVLYYCENKENEHVIRCMVGITVQTAESAAVYDVETGKVKIAEKVRIETVNAGEAADGKLAVGDVIKSIRVGDETYPVTRMFHVVDIMLNARVGDTVVFRVERDGTERDVEIPITDAALYESK